MCLLFICFMNWINAVNVEHITKCSVTQYYSSPTSFVHSCDHNQMAYAKNTVNIQISVQKYMIKPLCGTFVLQIKCNIIHFLTIFCILIVFLLCIFVIIQSDDSQNSDRNMLVKSNSILLNVFIMCVCWFII